MGRKKVIDSYVHNPANPVYVARKNLENARYEFNQLMAKRWIEHSERLQTELDRAILREMENGTNISEICRMYDTSSRNTIYALIERARERQQWKRELNGTDTEAGDFDVTTTEHPGSGGRQAYLVSTHNSWVHGKHEATLTVWDGEPWFLDTNADTPLHSELRDNWTTSPIANRVRQMEEN